MSVPRGFYETLQDCDDASPAFVRGVLVTQAQWAVKGIDLLDFPRWILYGGPFSTRQLAQVWDEYLFFNSAKQGLVWFGDKSPLCIVPSHRLQWPVNSSVQWTWVYEKEQPKRVKRVWSSAKQNYVFTWEN